MKYLTWDNLATAVNVEKRAVYLKDKYGDKRKVYGVLNDLIYLSYQKSEDTEYWETRYAYSGHVQELIRRGWTIEQPEQEPCESPEETIARLTKENEELKKKLSEHQMIGGARPMPLVLDGTGGFMKCQSCGSYLSPNSHHICGIGPITYC